MKAIRDAATVVLVREGREPFEVYMMRRAAGHEFMANAWVFPGGAMDDDDRGEAVAEVVAGVGVEEAARQLGENTEESTALGLYVAALRETFEEAGLLLASASGIGELLAIEDSTQRRRFDEFRRAVAAGEVGFAEMCRRQGLILRADQLNFIARWITPEFERRRYDTRFFVALAPLDQQASHDAGELVQGQWWTPSETIARYRRQEIVLAPPTLRILEEIALFESVQALLAELKGRARPPTILPYLMDDEGDEIALLLPGDREYPGQVPELMSIEPVGDGVTRLVLRDGLWVSTMGSKNVD